MVNTYHPSLHGLSPAHQEIYPFDYPVNPQPSSFPAAGLPNLNVNYDGFYNSGGVLTAMNQNIVPYVSDANNLAHPPQNPLVTNSYLAAQGSAWPPVGRTTHGTSEPSSRGKDSGYQSQSAGEAPGGQQGPERVGEGCQCPPNSQALPDGNYVSAGEIDAFEAGDITRLFNEGISWRPNAQ